MTCTTIPTTPLPFGEAVPMLGQQSQRDGSASMEG